MSEEGPNLGSKRGWRVFPGAADAQLLQQPRLSGPMPWVIAIMVALTVIAAAAGLALRNTANAAAEALAGGLTVQIVEPEPGYRARQTRAAVELLRSMPSIAEVRQVPQGEIGRGFHERVAATLFGRLHLVGRLVHVGDATVVDGRRCGDARGARGWPCRPSGRAATAPAGGRSRRRA